MTRIIVTPIVDHPVPKEDGSALSPDGETLKASMWWRRRERDGDVTIEPAPDRAPEDAASTPKADPKSAVKAPAKAAAKSDKKEG